MPTELLPSGSTDFKSQAFWVNAFKSRSKELSRWYGQSYDLKACVQTEATDLAGAEGVKSKNLKLLRLDISLENDISEKIHDDVGIRNQYVLSTDDIKAKSGHSKRNTIQWLSIDDCAEPLKVLGEEAAVFEIVLDRGMLDSLTHTHEDKASTYLTGLLARGAANGRVMVVSLCQDAVLRILAKYLVESKYFVKLQPLRLRDAASFDTSYIPFVVTIYKGQQDQENTLVPMTVDYRYFNQNTKPTSSNVYQIFKVCKELRCRSFFEQNVLDYHPGNLKFFELITTGQNACQYYMSMYDRTLPNFSTAKAKHEMLKNLKSTIAVLVPLADQHCWLYKTSHGHQRLAEKAGSRRILCVFLPDFGQIHPEADPSKTVARIKEDIGRHLLELAVDKSQPVLLMTQQENYTDDRQTVFMGSSDHAGKIRVFDAVVDQEDEELKETVEDEPVDAPKPAQASKYMRRTMIFECNPRMAQSEVWFLASKRKGLEVSEFDYSHICHAYHLMMLSSISWLPSFYSTEPLSGALLGLGGGVFASVLRVLLGGRLKLACVELDPVIADIAEQHFGFTKDDNTSLHLGDGCAYIEQLATQEAGLHDFIIVDINKTTGDIGVEYEGVSCPPIPFLQESFLEAARKLLKPNGIVLYNVVIHKDVGQDRVVTQLQKVFPTILMMKHSQDLNHVMVCSDNKSVAELATKDIKSVLYKISSICPSMSKVISRTPMYLGKHAAFAPAVRDF
eukprot:Blabericola_migrator_1__5154@NODE_265_length_10621_cov_160_318363_g221_i0_p1_GENE_NODE_265_length_10621_cov_160_318363_g221_i0NODE_265_length_10621_cov_160_318363_g221_i0_p1_ORF_typecomplete_len732_score102_91Spermine_synth/PF01564_17/1_7e17Methyltransf_3/PF01596_17/4_3e05PCMT/PF01135_19/5_4e02PCMT/PF01135_19/0_017Methyltransf_31/PF13847_6/1e03Methyltransf_31/PF13847_6/0_58_NODE_265_length_10621_cov_160_318363_g221_i059218116